MSKISNLIEQITSKEFIEADKLFEQLMAEKVSAGIQAKTALINEEMMAANPDLFQSPVDQDAALDHAPVEAEHSERTDEIEVPDPVEVDGSYEGHPSPAEQKAMSEDYAQFSESHDFEADEDEQHQHPENVAAEPVGASAEENQATQAMHPSNASPEQVEESLDHDGVGAVCEDCGAEVMAEEEHVCEAKHEDLDEENLQELTPANFGSDLMSYGKGWTDTPLQAAKRFVNKHGAAKTGAAALGGVAALGAAAGAGKRGGERLANIGSKKKAAMDEEQAQHLEEKKGEGRNMNRLGTTLGGMAIGSALGTVGGTAAGVAGAAASGVTDPKTAEGIVRGAGALGNLAGSLAGGVKGWKHATKQNKAMYGDKKKAVSEEEVEEELSPKQKKIDLNKNGKIDGSDLSKLRKEEDTTHEEE